MSSRVRASYRGCNWEPDSRGVAETQLCPADACLQPFRHGEGWLFPEVWEGQQELRVPYGRQVRLHCLWREAAVHHICGECTKEKLGNRKGVGDVVALTEGAELPHRRVVGSARGRYVTAGTLPPPDCRTGRWHAAVPHWPLTEQARTTGSSSFACKQR